MPDNNKYNNSSNNTDSGFLEINVFELTKGRPADNATVRISLPGSSIAEELHTNSSGKTVRISLPAPPLEYSMKANMPRPFSEYDVSVFLQGFDPVHIRNVQIYSGATAIQNVYMQPSVMKRPPHDIYIEPPAIWGNFPPKIPEHEVKPLPPSSEFVVLPNPVIPEYIIVHNGVPSNASADNYWVNFTDYIKNVASSEIYATWPLETIKANVLAIISITMNRVYTEWYRSKGFDFTITNSTQFDQAYSRGRNIYEEISVVVDDLFNTYITRVGIKQPLFTQYCDGRRSSCPDWMTQWGSKALGDKGLSAIDILRTYYGSDIYLVPAEKVEGIPLSYSGVSLTIGSAEPDVRVIQEQLNGISRNFPAINKMKVNGVYDQNTASAVKTFQSVFNLPQTGIVDFRTWYKISEIYVSVTKMAE